MSDTAIILGVVVALLGFAGAVTAAVVAARQKGLTDLVTALQERIEEQDDRLGEQEVRINRLERRDRAWADYVHKLRAHISNGYGPPPPDYPDNLDR